MLIDKEKYEASLISLWHTVFGDSHDYIKLIFNKDFSDSILCFGLVEEEQVVSAFYLLKSVLSFEGKNYTGYYLYAAATLPEYRKKGIMSNLIEEAKAYCEKEKLDFISLVPSNDSLYSYYSKSAFVEAMYRFELKGEALSIKNKPYELVGADEYNQLRFEKIKNIFLYKDTALNYAAVCLGFGGYELRKTEKDLYIYNEKLDDYIEILPGDNLSSDKSRFGMIYPINKELERNWKYTDIYMNIALD